MARPFWFKLFGPNGPTNFAELRTALLTVPTGDGSDSGQFVTNIRTILGLSPAAARSAQHEPVQTSELGIRDQVSLAPVVGAAPSLSAQHEPDQTRDFGIRDQVILASAVTAWQELAAAPAPAPVATDAVATVSAPTPAESAVNLGDSETGRSETLHINGMMAPPIAGSPSSPFARVDTSVPYMLVGDLQSGLVIDTHNKTVMQGGAGDYPELLAGLNDSVVLEGDYSAGFGFAVPPGVEQVRLQSGNDHNLIADDNAVTAGGTLTIDAMPLGDANHVLFDGTAETDGRFLFYGSDAGDMFLGGGGNDRIYGLGGGDVLSGGGGSDTFVYYDAAHSSGADYDMLADFNPTADRIDLEVSVTGFDAAIQGGALSTGSFDADLGTALSGLGAGHAVLYAPDAGDLAGNLFLIVDANGIAGYQEGEDYVFAIGGATLADLQDHTGFFI